MTLPSAPIESHAGSLADDGGVATDTPASEHLAL